MPAEAKVGALVLFTLLLAAGLAIFLSGRAATWGAYRITVQFEDVLGLEPGRPVKLAGVEIGKVGDVKLQSHKSFPRLPVAVVLRINPGTILYKSDRFLISQGSLMGDQYVMVQRVPKEKKREKVAADETVAGSGGLSTEILLSDAKALVAEARAAVASSRLVLDDAQMWADLKGTMSNLNQATARAIQVTDEALRFTTSLARTGEQSEEKVARLLDHVVAAAADVQSAAERVDKMIALSPLPAQLAASGENIRQATSDIAAIAADTRTMVDDSQMQEQIAQSVKNLREASGNLRQLTGDAAAIIGDEQLAADVRVTLANVREASESLKHLTTHTEDLITDPKTSEDLRASLENLRAATDAGRQAAERADSVFDHVDQSMEAMRNTQSMIREIETRTGIQLRAAKSDGLRADAHLDLRLSPRSADYWRVGIRDLGDDERLDLQWFHQLGDDRFRAGLFGSHLGLGYDHGLGHRSLEVELYKPDDPHLDLRGRWSLQNQYDLLLGVEAVFDDNDPFVGLGWQGEF